MEDQGKRLLLAVGVAFALMLAWQFLFPPAKPKPKPKPEVAETVDGKAPAETGVDGETPVRTAPDGADAPASCDNDEPVEFAFERFAASMSRCGGTLSSWRLNGKSFEDRSKEGNPPQELVVTGDNQAWRPFAVWFADSTHGIPDGSEWKVSNKTDTTVDFTFESSALRVVKHFEFEPKDYLLQMTVDVTKLSRGEAEQSLAVSTYGFQKPGDGGGSSFGSRVSRTWEAICLIDGGDVRQATVGELAKGERGDSGRVRFAGFSHSYFLAAMAPKNENEERLHCLAAALPGRDGAMEMMLVYPAITIRDGDPTYTRTLSGYFGPKYMDRLQATSELVGYETSFEESVNFGILSILCRPLLWLLQMFQSFVINWGIAIILLTLVVQAITLPWTTKSMRSMKAMAKLRPQMEKIKEKFPNDKQRQQVEIMGLYKAHKVNPLAGCLPMVLQMPIWFALYRSLSLAAELYQAPFIPGWLDDLTSPDPYYIMPVVLTGMMFLQTKLQPNPVESTQQKVMMYGMPIMFGVFSFFFPSGLTLYILTNTILRTSHQLYLNRGDDDGKSAAGTATEGDKPASTRAKETADRPDDDDEPAVDNARDDSNGDAATVAGKRAGKPRKKSKRKKTGGRTAKS